MTKNKILVRCLRDLVALIQKDLVFEAEESACDISSRHRNHLGLVHMLVALRSIPELAEVVLG